jgi:hypothetical protein
MIGSKVEVVVLSAGVEVVVVVVCAGVVVVVVSPAGTVLLFRCMRNEYIGKANAS